MSVKKFGGAPFGTQTARFDVSGIHPKSKTPGTFTEFPYDKHSTDEVTRRLGPGLYNVYRGGFSEHAVEERSSGPGWARAHEVEKMAALPHLLHKEQWELKRLLQRKLGPGSYDIQDSFHSTNTKPGSSRGICQTLATRFKDSVSSNTPGPGTYGKGGIPQTVMEEKSKQSFSTVGMLDSGAKLNRNPTCVGSELAPGRYNYSSFVDELEKKVTSNRGPYDLFSGDRNKPITTGHLAAPALANLGPGQYSLKSFTDDWGTLHKKKHGKFGSLNRFPAKPSERMFCQSLAQCPRNASEPGPGHYDHKRISKSASSNAPGFLSSAQRNDRISQKFFTRNSNPVGAGRYDVQRFDECQHKNGHTSVFKSRTTKPNAEMAKFLKERIRAKDVRVEDRVFLVTPEPPTAALQRTNTQTDWMARKAATVM
ncbi:ciliary microtubule-associated protein 2-like [Liolophura sinensis]|uniref:ciliary microtubule-associated protein 2-like n=1 Tax=Liolophura sinensis TaxID=3198878 RepID=UPI00315810FA